MPAWPTSRRSELGTAVTPAGVERFEAAHPLAFVCAGLKPPDATEEAGRQPVN